jgi:O-antigen/teichoic acid export membrane protein
LPTVTKNLIGNFVGRGIGAALSLLLIPVYIRFLGVEAFGLVGFFLVLQTVFGILDLGLSTTTNREVAMRVADDRRRGETRDLLRTVEAIYWPIGLVIGVVLVIAAPVIARHWLHPAVLSVGTIEAAIRLMGITAALQWPYTIYEGALHGLQRIIEFNTVAAGMQVVRALGAVLVVRTWPTITAFFTWQLIVSAITALLFAFSTWKYMPPGPPPRVRLVLMRDLWRFAAGMTASVALGVVLTQADRIVLSRMLSLESFGYYSVAATVATGLVYFMSPISLTVLPRFTQLLAQNEDAKLVRTYHLSAQLMTVVLTSVALTIALFSRELLMIWTRNPHIAERGAPLLTVLVTAMLMRAYNDIPYMMQLSQGRARLAVYTNLISVAVYLPLLAFLVGRYGALGAAIALLVLDGAKFAIWGHVVHAQILPEEKWRWYLFDVGRPALAAALVGVAARLLIPRALFGSIIVGLLLLGVVVAMSAAAALAVAPLTRERAFAILPRLRQLASGRSGNRVAEGSNDEER